MAKSDTKMKDGWTTAARIYFLLIGIFDFLAGSFLDSVFSPYLFGVVYPILFATGLYAFKKQSLTFALEAFILSLIAFYVFTISFSIVSVSELLLLYPIGFFAVPVIALILSVAGVYVFKDNPLVKFAIKAFAISFIPFFMILTGVVLVATTPFPIISLEEVPQPGEAVPEITKEELKGYPALESVIEKFKKYYPETPSEYSPHTPPSYGESVSSAEWTRTRDFIEKKKRDGEPIFGIDGRYYMIILVIRTD